MFTSYRGFQIIQQGNMFVILASGSFKEEFDSVNACKLWIDAEILLAKKR